MADRILVFTQDGCPPCEMLKTYIDQKGIECTRLEVHTEIPVEAVEKMYPECEGFPFTVVNGEPIGDLIYYLESGL